MKFVECVACGIMMSGLVLGAMTGAIAMLLVPMAAGLAIAGIASWLRSRREHSAISFSTRYPPYGY